MHDNRSALCFQGNSARYYSIQIHYNRGWASAIRIRGSWQPLHRLSSLRLNWRQEYRGYTSRTLSPGDDRSPHRGELGCAFSALKPPGARDQDADFFAPFLWGRLRPARRLWRSCRKRPGFRVMSTIDLPVPPSVNRGGGRGRVYRSKRYTARSKVAGWELAMQRPKRITGQVIVTIAASWICWLRTRSSPILRRATRFLTTVRTQQPSRAARSG